MITLETRMKIVLETIYEHNHYKGGRLHEAIGRLLDEYNGNQTTVESLTDEPMFEKDNHQNRETK